MCKAVGDVAALPPGCRSQSPGNTYVGTGLPALVGSQPRLAKAVKLSSEGSGAL